MSEVVNDIINKGIPVNASMLLYPQDILGLCDDKKKVEGQFDLFNYKLAEIAHELDQVNLNELTPIDALNTLVKIKEKMK